MFTCTAPFVENAVLRSSNGLGVLVKNRRPSADRNSPLLPADPHVGPHARITGFGLPSVWESGPLTSVICLKIALSVLGPLHGLEDWLGHFCKEGRWDFDGDRLECVDGSGWCRHVDEFYIFAAYVYLYHRFALRVLKCSMIELHDLFFLLPVSLSVFEHIHVGGRSSNRFISWLYSVPFQDPIEILIHFPDNGYLNWLQFLILKKWFQLKNVHNKKYILLL